MDIIKKSKLSKSKNKNTKNIKIKSISTSIQNSRNGSISAIGDDIISLKYPCKDELLLLYNKIHENDINEYSTILLPYT